ncbi:polyprenyl synthetase family protein [Corticicoccus populi]|uniref:Polyprenyl synthetase family protein n=1 Tax=Corticicoccus populi TaxID=1812821 RepID=A0ABW5WTR9_9STAP
MNNEIKHWLSKTEEAIQTHLDNGRVSKTIRNASLYSVNAGGKRFRPYLLFSVLKSLNADLSLGVKAAAALEMIHTYSLIHDDLPAMDDDELRRGNPTNHIVFGEAAAILAGDNLLTESFNLLSNDTSLEESTRLKLIRILSECAGQNGMIGGQMLDIEGEVAAVSLEELENIHRFKTGHLISAPVQMACTIVNAEEQTASVLSRFSEKLGIIFQIRDDILDVTGDVEVTGKNTGSDERKEKTTYVSELGLEGARAQLDLMQQEAAELLKSIGNNIDTASLNEVLNRFAIREQ